MKTIIIDGIEYNLTPKVLFKKGDFVVIQETTYLISKIEGLNVTLSCNGRDCLFDIDVLKSARLWDITKDAKDGDMLCYKDEISLYKHNIKNCTKQETTFGGFVYYCCYDGKRFVVDSIYSITEQDKMDIHPATKEQREQLEKAMVDAGYRWNPDDKKMEKIEQPKLTEFEDAIKDMMDDYRDAIDDNDATIEEVKEKAAYLLSLIPCKPAEWSEEDERALNDAIVALSMYANGDIPPILPSILLEDVEKLKSLRPQNTWKLSDEQNPAWSEEDERMYRGLHNLIYSTPHCDSRKELSDWLKSLKDRVQPQPKQEWSEEDEKCIRLSTDIIDSALRAGFCVQLDRDRCVDWLKSLRPQNRWKKSLKTADLENNLWWIQGSFSDTSREYRILGEAIEYIRCTEPSWRPSDEQMYNLSEAAHYNCAFFDMEILKELYDNLKKLREE